MNLRGAPLLLALKCGGGRQHARRHSPEEVMDGSVLGRLSLEPFLLLGFRIPHGVPSFLPVHSVVEDLKCQQDLELDFREHLFRIGLIPYRKQTVGVLGRTLGYFSCFESRKFICSCVVLNNLLFLSGPRFSHLCNGIG